MDIRIGLLEQLLFEINCKCADQPLLCALYKELFSITYYGLMRVGEVTKGDHPVLVKDVHVGYSTRNKINRILLHLHTSKMHGKESYPQEIKISQSKICNVKQVKQTRCFCPFELFNQYLVFRGLEYETDTEQFFIFSDKSPNIKE